MCNYCVLGSLTCETTSRQEGDSEHEPILQKKKLRLKETRTLAQAHLVSKPSRGFLLMPLPY